MIHKAYHPIIKVVGNGRVAGKFGIIGYEGGPRGFRIAGPSIIASRFDFSRAWKSTGHFSRDVGLSAGFRSISSCSACLAEPVTSFAGDIVVQTVIFLLYRVTLVTGSLQWLRCRHSVNTRTRKSSCISVGAATSFSLLPLQRTDSQAKIFLSISLQLTDYSLSRCPEQQAKPSAQLGLSKYQLHDIDGKAWRRC